MTDLIDAISAHATTVLSDAIEAIGATPRILRGVTPLWSNCPAFAGRALTLEVGPGRDSGGRHLGVTALQDAQPGSVLVIGGGMPHIGCFGGILAHAAAARGIAGVLADGWCRDVDDFIDLGLPVFARGPAVLTARGRVIQVGYGNTVACGGTAIHSGDLVVADCNGALVFDFQLAPAVLRAADEISRRELAMIDRIRSGEPIESVDKQADYESMLTNLKASPST